MANTFHDGIIFYNQFNQVEPGTVWVEIGSERGEGSTLALAGQAERYGTHLYSVDVDSYAKQNLRHPALTCFVESGSAWANKTWPTIAKKISLLHLDNFDWIWEVHNISDPINEQIYYYKKTFNMIMNNENCQQEHFEQVLALSPWLAHNCLIICDDTFLTNGVWSGKAGPAVVYLKTQGFRIIKTSNNGGTLLSRGFDQLYPVDQSNDTVLY